jgi:hypothetical protein
MVAACSLSASANAHAISAGVAAVTQIRADENPGRAGSNSTSGTGPSAMAVGLPSPSSNPITGIVAGCAGAATGQPNDPAPA